MKTRFRWLGPLTFLAAASIALAQDVASGPDNGKRIPPLKVFAATGPKEGKDVDYAEERKDKPTIYVFVQADKWDRPMARFLKKLDDAVKEDGQESQVVAVWLTENADDTKAYLPKAQQSLQLQASILTCFTGEKAGPKNWNVNTDAHLTVVVANKQKVAARFGYRSVNETDVPAVQKALNEAKKKE